MSHTRTSLIGYIQDSFHVNGFSTLGADTHTQTNKVANTHTDFLDSRNQARAGLVRTWF